MCFCGCPYEKYSSWDGECVCTANHYDGFCRQKECCCCGVFFNKEDMEELNSGFYCVSCRENLEVHNE